ncbi:MAG: hypothetical protein ACOCVF_00970 [bacterium]
MKINSKYKIPLTGSYNRGVYICNNCNLKLLGDNPFGGVADHIIGFADSKIGLVCIIECPKCFEKWFFHVGFGGLNYYDFFLDSIEMGYQKHYKL